MLSFKELIGCGLIIFGTILGGTSTSEHEHEHDKELNDIEKIPLCDSLPETRKKDSSITIQKNYGSTR